MQDSGRSPWDVLGVAENASFSEVKKAYLRRVRATHPDVAGGNAPAFREVQAAFEALRRSAPRPERSSRPAPSRSAPSRSAPTTPRPPASPYDSWLREPPRARVWIDDDPLVSVSTATATPRGTDSFADVLVIEMDRLDLQPV